MPNKLGGCAEKWVYRPVRCLEPVDNMINNNENFSKLFICIIKNIIADSGCTKHYICTLSPCISVMPCKNGIQVKQPDGAVMTSSHTALLDFPHLPDT